MSNHKMSEVHEEHDKTRAGGRSVDATAENGGSRDETCAEDEKGADAAGASRSLAEENERLREQIRSMRTELDRLRGEAAGLSPAAAKAVSAAAAAAAAAVLTEPPLPHSTAGSPDGSPSKHLRGGPGGGGAGGLSRFGRAVAGKIATTMGRAAAAEEEVEYATLATSSDVTSPGASPVRESASHSLEAEDVEAGTPTRSRTEGLEMNPLAGPSSKKEQKRSGGSGDDATLSSELDAEDDDGGGAGGDTFGDESLNAAAVRNRPPPENGVDYLPFYDVMKDRAGWLVGLLVLQSMSSFIIARNEALLESHLVIVQFLTMLVGAGGNAGNQASVRVIRGLAVGTLNGRTLRAFLWTETKMAVCLSGILGVAGLLRAAVFQVPAAETTAITSSLYMIVFLSIFIGSLLPLGMKWCGIDPAHSSTTIQVLMDILGVTMTVHVSSLILNTGIGDVITSWFSGGADGGSE